MLVVACERAFGGCSGRFASWAAQRAAQALAAFLANHVRPHLLSHPAASTHTGTTIQTMAAKAAVFPVDGELVAPPAKGGVRALAPVRGLERV